MLKGKEFAIILVVSIIFAFIISLVRSFEIFLYTLATAFLVIIINVLGLGNL